MESRDYFKQQKGPTDEEVLAAILEYWRDGEPRTPRWLSQLLENRGIPVCLMSVGQILGERTDLFQPNGATGQYRRIDDASDESAALVEGNYHRETPAPLPSTRSEPSNGFTSGAIPNGTEGSALDGRREQSHADLWSDIEMRLARLRYSESSAWLPLPDWARFYMRIGALAAAERHEGRLVIALSLPTLSFAAAFCAAGVVLRRAASASNDPTGDAHWQWLTTLQLGAPVEFADGGTVKYGRFIGIHRMDEGPMAGVEYEKHGGKHWFPPSSCHKIRPADHERQLPEHQKGRLNQPLDPLLKNLLADDSAQRFARHDRPACVVVANLARCSCEIDGVTLDLDGQRGGLVDLLRPPGHPGGTLTELIPTTGSREQRGPTPPPVAIFAGSAAFLKRRGSVSQASRVVILDRTERGFAEGVAELNAAYTKRLIHCCDIEWPAAPAGIEMMAFQEVMR